MSWYTKEEIEKLVENEELRMRIARFVTMTGEEFLKKCEVICRQRNWRNI